MTGSSHLEHSVLVVDDQEGFRKSLRRLLTQEGIRVLEAESGRHALDLVAERLPCFALVDLVMPGMDGLTLCRHLRQDPRTAHLPLVLVTGEDLAPDLEQCAELRVSDFIRKPLDLNEMRFRIRTQIRLHEALLEQQKAHETLEAITCTLRASEERYRASFDSASVGQALVSRDGQYIEVNRTFANMLGYTPAELREMTFMDITHPEDLTASTEARKGLVSGKAQTHRLEKRYLRKDGSVIWVDMNIGTVQDSRGIGTGFITHIIDISERKQVEERLRVQEAARRRMEVELRHSQKLEAVGQLAAGIAHEINTPTQFVGDSLYFIKEAFDGFGKLLPKYRAAMGTLAGQTDHAALAGDVAALENEVDLEYLLANLPDCFERCFDGVGRITNIVRAMKEFAHPGPKEKRPADLNHAIKNTLVIASNEYKYVADVETDLGEIPAVLCQLDDVNQVFLNLIVNAAHAISDVVANSGGKGKIRVSTRVDGDFVCVDIADTGAGIPEEIRERVFEPFFTTKPVGKGTGQGLAIARFIVVDKHCGTLTFQSAAGAGTTFTIRLPIDGRAVAQREAS